MIRKVGAADMGVEGSSDVGWLQFPVRQWIALAVVGFTYRPNKIGASAFPSSTPRCKRASCPVALMNFRQGKERLKRLKRSVKNGPTHRFTVQNNLTFVEVLPRPVVFRMALNPDSHRERRAGAGRTCLSWTPSSVPLFLPAHADRPSLIAL